MEAKALHDFNASSQDELSFQKGSIVKVINNEDDKNWFKAEQDGRSGYIPANYVQMLPHEWMHGKISRVKAEELLLSARAPAGKGELYLFRESESAPGGFSLSVRVNNKQGVHVQHFKILRDDAGKYFLWVVKFKSLNELITYHKTSSVSRNEDIFLGPPLAKGANAGGGGGAPRGGGRAAAPPAAAGGKVVTAQYNFEPQEAGELAFKKGDKITITDDTNADWWKGSVNGSTGLFPATYVK